jgi:hypothetical protein
VRGFAQLEVQLQHVDDWLGEGNPDPKHVSTSFSERQNLSMRMGNRRMTRLTNAFSKKAANHAHMMAIYFMHYNFVRIHQTLKVTPAMAAGVTEKPWEMSDMVKVFWKIGKIHKLTPSQKVPVVNFIFADRTFFQKGRILSFRCLTRERGGYGYGQVRQR